ncbi:MAG: hypothetical protein WEA34_04075 [Gemmatimonadota bacterium]
MKYYVYLNANTCVYAVTIESDGEPEVDGPRYKIGNSVFSKENVLAMVPESEHESSRPLGIPSA